MKYFLGKSASFLLTLVLLCASVFVLLRVAPGGPFDGEKALPPEILENLNRHYGLDLPIDEQLIHWFGQLLNGDLGESFQYIGRPVTELIIESVQVSAVFGVGALLLSLLGGCLIGAFAAFHRNNKIDRLSQFVVSLGNTVPSYLFAGTLVLIFSKWLELLPPALLDEPGSWILPLVTLAIRPLSMVLQLTRSSVTESLQTEYIRTAVAKGASQFRVLFHHALRNSLIPLIGLLGPLTANLLTGSFLVETVFQIPGMGKYFVSAVINRDYPLVMGVTLFYGTLLLATTWISDLLYGWVDPRIRLNSQSTPHQESA